MGKHSKRGKSSVGSDANDHQVGCIGGMLHALDYHRWGNKHHRKHRPIAICWRNQRTHSLEHETAEEQPFLDSKDGNSRTLMKKTINKDLSQQQVLEYVDILEILNANKEAFVKILKDPALGFGKQFHIQGIPGRLAKSGSFPVSGSSRASSLRPITNLEHKQKENWSEPKANSLVLTLDAPRLSSDDELKEDLEQKASFRESKGHGFNHIVMHGFREIKKWLRKALQDPKNKKKHYSRTSLQEKGVSDNDLRSKMKHTSSLYDSLERYSQLFEQSFRRDVKFHSKSLKITNEYETSASRGNQPKFFRRISSLSSLESFGSFLTELSRDSTVSSNLEIRTSVDHDIEKSTFQKNIIREKESRESADLLERRIASESHKDTPVAIDFPDSVVPSEEEGPVSVPKIHSCDNTPKKTQVLFSEDSDLIDIDGLDSSAGLQTKSNCDDNPQELSTKHKIEDHYQHDEDEDEPCFFYLKNVLELSGFLANKDLSEKWHSEDQPIDPSLIFKLNPQAHEELDNKELLFDLVNEALADTYKQSHIYFPKAFSFTHRIYPMPEGKHLLDEVWGRIQWSLSGLWANKEDCSLDDLVAGDLAKADGWMNVQVEAEWLALEIEDLIFDEILDELVCTC